MKDELRTLRISLQLDQGRYIIEVNKDDLKKVTNLLNKNSVHFDQLGEIKEKNLTIDKKTDLSVDDLKTFNTSWLKDYMSK